MLVFLPKQVVTRRCVIFCILSQRIHYELFGIPKLIFYLTYKEHIDVFLHYLIAILSDLLLVLHQFLLIKLDLLIHHYNFLRL